MTPTTPVPPLDVVVNEPNRWRLDTPGHRAWPRTARPDDPRKYFMVSADCHANEPHDLWATRIDEKYRARVPKVITDEDGVRQRVGAGPRERLRYMDYVGIDGEVIFPNTGLSMWATPDPVFAMAQ